MAKAHKSLLTRRLRDLVKSRGRRILSASCRKYQITFGLSPQGRRVGSEVSFSPCYIRMQSIGNVLHLNVCAKRLIDQNSGESNASIQLLFRYTDKPVLSWDCRFIALPSQTKTVASLDMESGAALRASRISAFLSIKY
jgi:hypothetical protein